MGLMRVAKAGGSGQYNFAPTQTYTNESYSGSSDSHVFTIPANTSLVHATLTFGTNRGNLIGYMYNGSFVTSSEKDSNIRTFTATVSGDQLTLSVTTEVIGITSITINLDTATI